MVDSKLAVITGGNKGLGLEIARQLARDHKINVILGARDSAKGKHAESILQSENLNVTYRHLDLLSDESIKSFSSWLKKEKGQFEILINNAGILLERHYGQDKNIEVDGLEVDIEVMKKIFDTNLFGTIRVTQNLVKNMRNGGRVINLSSRMGQFEWADTNMLGYRLSKTAVNGLTASLAVRLASREISVNCLCPGWVLTDMGSKFAQISVEEGAKTAVWLATSAEKSLTGKFFFEKKEIPW